MADKDAQKKVLADVAKPHDLKKTETHESTSVAQAKILNAVKKGTDNLHHHVDAPKDGLSEAEKQAYLEEKKASEKK